MRIELAFDKYGKATNYICYCGEIICNCAPTACDLVNKVYDKACYREVIEDCPICLANRN